MPSVSVIITTYNRCKIVQETIASVLAQSFQDFELIVVDDGSEDETQTELSVLAQAGKVKYIRQENSGLAVARNHGLREAQGEFAAFLDDDDLWPTDKLQWQVAWLRTHPEFGGITGIFEFIGAKSSVPMQFNESGHEITFEKMFDGCPCVSVGATLVRTELVRQLGGFFDGIWGTQDYDLWIHLAARTRFWKENRLALYYRVHPGSMSTQTLRAYRNAWRTIKRGLALARPDQHRALAQRGYRSTYFNHAQALTWEWRQYLLRGHFLKFCQCIIGLGEVGYRFLKYDRAGFKIFVRDLLSPFVLVSKRLKSMNVVDKS